MSILSECRLLLCVCVHTPVSTAQDTRSERMVITLVKNAACLLKNSNCDYYKRKYVYIFVCACVHVDVTHT